MARARLAGLFSWYWILFLYFAILAKPVVAGERADLQWDFASHLYQEQDFYRALSEYHRFVFLFPNDSRVSEAKLQIGRCYRLDGRLDKAFSHLLGLYQSISGETVEQEALLEMAAIREEQNRYPEATHWIKQFLERYPGYPEIDTIHVRLAWLQIDSGKYQEAVATLDLIQPESADYHRARSLRQALQQRPETTEKSPQTAGVLSALLPGAGHFYAGRPEQAVSSFLLNAIFITGTVVAFKNDSPVLGGILVFFELGWYIGGIRSAAQAAREENEARAKKYRRELKQDYRLSLGLEPGNDRVAFSLRLSF